jgi:hypothetical protein
LRHATRDEVKAALDGLSSIGDVGVVFPKGLHKGANMTVCHPSYVNQTGVVITFFTELGALPLIKGRFADGSPITVLETSKGTKENAECSNRGICDYATGMCQCLPGFAGSSGNQSFGLRRDCGMRTDDGFTLNPYYK